ncbi:MAG: metallophosphoesterase, partial [Candidatus Binatia bacterium]
MSRRIIFSLLIAVFALAWTSQAAAQTVTRGPYLQNATSTSMVVRWRTNVNTDSRVIYGLSQGGLSSEVIVGTMTTEHEIQLTELSPETTYYYAIGTSGSILAGGDSDHYFSTAPVPGTEPPVRVWVIGDSGTANSSARAVRDAYLAFNGGAYTKAWLMLGDNAYSDGTDSQYQDAVFDMYPSLLRKTSLWATLGNHDGHSADSGSQTGPYYNIFTLPKFGEGGGLASGTEAYYSFDYANVHFVCLDSYDSSKSTGGAMLTWLENDLAATTQKWIVAFWHHPPYSKGSHNSDSSGTLTSVRENFLPILESYGVDLVLSGHSHSYERSYQIDGHYGSSGSFTPSQHLIDGGDGREDGNGAYFKDMLGSVYIVAGSSGKTGGGSLNHPIMYRSLNQLGSLVLDFAGDRLDAKFIDDGGSIRDYFTILKAPAGNQAPTVSAGADQSVIFSEGASLDGTVSDDGLPDPPRAVTTLWSQVGGPPGTVTFDDASAVDTTASFSVVDTYVLRLTANDGKLESTDDVTITVLPGGTINQPPIVDAGPDQTVALSINAILDGTVTDEGLPNPPGEVTTNWSQVSGPGTVNFVDASAVDTAAGFSMEGTYVLGLRGFDGGINAFDEVTITVEQAPQMLEIRVSTGDDDAEESQSGSVGLGSSDLELIRESSDQTVGMRFNGVTIPQGAAITNAYIQFQADETDSGATYLTIEGQNIGNAPTFSSSSGNISSRARTAASVSWNPVPWTSTGQAGLDQQTPDIAFVIQEIINRLDWFEGNSLVIIITGTGKRVAESRNGSSSGAPLLHVEYTTGPVANRAPSVDA